MATPDRMPAAPELPPPGRSLVPGSGRYLLAVLVVAAAYFAAGKLGLSLAFFHASASPVWPPSGLALAVLILSAGRLWPAIFLGAFLVNFTTQGTQGSVLTCLGIAAGNTLEGVVGARLMIRWAGGRGAFRRVRRLMFVPLAIMASTCISASMGVFTLVVTDLASWNQFPLIWFTWWSGDVTGALMVTPLLLNGRQDLWTPWPRKKAWEAACLSVLTILVAVLVFHWPSAFAQRYYPIEYLCLPVAVVVGLRLRPGAACGVLLLLSAIAIHGSLNGLGPFAIPHRNVSLLLLQGFMGVLMLTGLSLSALALDHQRLRLHLERANTRIRTANAKLEQRVAARTKELSETNKELESFCYSVSHDLRAPLRHIEAYIQIIQQDAGAHLPRDSVRHLDVVADAARRMSRLIDALLLFSRVGRAQLHPQTVNMEVMVQEVIDELMLQAPSRDVDWRVGPLPDATGDRAMLRLVWTNLLDNACKYTGKAPQAVIEVTGQRANGECAYSIRDNGAGFDMRHKHMLFGVFQRLHGSADYEGTGIGLANVRRIVERHGGRVWAEGEKGKGATFHFALPQGAPVDAGNPSSTKERIPSPLAPLPQGERGP